MPFLYPLYLLGTLAAGIPVVIHMIHKRRAQRVLFPTIRFLKASTERTSRRQKIQDLFLLILRILLLVLLAFALAQPFLGSRAFGIGRRVHAVILLDNSYSMGTEHERKARYQTAKELASVVVDSLPKGSRAAVLLASPPYGYPTPLLTDVPETLRRDIHRAPLSQARADLTAAVQRAYDFLAADQAPTLEVYAITDLQRNAWSSPSPAELEKEKQRVRPNLVVVDCARDDYRNLAVTELAVHGGARVRDRPVSIQAKIHNFTPKTASVNVTLYVDRTKQMNQQLEIPGNLIATASFHHKFDDPGIHTGWVQIDDDSLALDNRRDFCIEIQDHIPALLLRDAQAEIPQLDPTFFIAKALDPYSDDPSKTRSLVQTTVTNMEQLGDDTIPTYKVVILADVGSFRKTQMDVLRRYVRAGGHLIVFCGPNTKPKELNYFLNGEQPSQALLPVEVHDAAQGIVDRKDFKSLVVPGYDHPVLRGFQSFRRLPETVKVYNCCPMDVPQNSPARILIQLSDGNPFLLENNFGNGRVLLFATTTDPDWSNLAASRFFLPLLHRVVYYLTERQEIESIHFVGYPVNITLHELGHAVTVQVRDPDGEVMDVKAKPEKGVTRAVFAQTDKRGPYIYLVLDPKRPTEKEPDAAKTEAESGFVINPDSQESDLAKMPQHELAALFPGRRLHFAASPEELRSTINRMREGIPLRNLILYLVLFIAIFECFFANRVVPALQRAEEKRTAPVGT